MLNKSITGKGVVPERYGLVLFNTEDIDTIDIYIKTNSGVFTEEDVKDGAITADYTLYNKYNLDLAVKLTYQLFDGSVWAGFNDNPVIVPAYSKVDVNFSIPVTDNKVTYNGVQYDISELFVRIDMIGSTSQPIEAGTSIVIEAADGDPLFDLVANSNYNCFTQYYLPPLSKATTVTAPSGIEITNKNQINVIDIFIKSSDGVFSQNNIYNNEFVGDYTVYNPNDFDVNLMLTYQVYNGTIWTGFNDTPITVPAKHKKDVNFSIDVNETSSKDKFVVLGNGRYDISSLFVRVDVLGSEDAPIPAGTSIIIEAPTNDRIYKLSDNSNYSTKFVYTLPDLPLSVDTPSSSPSVSQSPSPVPAKTVTNGDAENGTKNWDTFIGGNIEVVSPGADGTGNAIKYTPVNVCKFGSVAFDLGPAIINEPDLGYNGGGAGEYEITFKAKADANNTNNTFIFFLNSQAHYQEGEQIGDYTLTRDTYTSAGSVILTEQWKDYSVTVNVTESLLKEINTVYKLGQEDAYQLVFRLDGNSNAFANSFFSYYIDDVTITKKTEGIPEGKIIGATLDIGSSLTLNYFAKAPENSVMRIISSSEKVTVIDGILDSETGYYKFAYEGINPQCMSDTINAELIYDGTLLDTKNNYSVKEYCENQITKSAKELNLTDSQFETLKALLADMLVYGSQAQTYRNYNASNLPDTSQWVDTYKSTFVVPNGVRNVTGNADTENKVKSVGLNMANVNRIYFKLALSDENVVITLNDEVIDRKELIENSDGTYTLYSSDIYATEFDDIYTLTLTKGDEVLSTVEYNVNAYIQAKHSSDGLSGIVKALANYGKSAKRYQGIFADGDFDLEGDDL